MSRASSSEKDRKTKLATISIALLLPTSLALAQQRPPIGSTPQPAIGAGCPTGYQRSGGACVPGPNTRCRAFPRAGGTCPAGASFDYCVGTGCQSR